MSVNSRLATVVGAMNSGEGVNYSPKSPVIFHKYTKSRTFVKKVTGLEVLTKYRRAQEGKMLVGNEIYYAICSRGGIVDWDNTIIYNASDLVGVDNVFVVGLNRV